MVSVSDLKGAMPTSFCVLSSGQRSQTKVVLGTESGDLLFLDLTGKIQKKVAEAHTGELVDLKASKDGQSMISVGEDGTVKLWSNSGLLRKKIAGFEEYPTAFDWSNDSALLAVGTPNKITIKHLINNITDSKISIDANDPESPACANFLSWSPCSKYLLMGSELGQFVVYSDSAENVFASDFFSLPFEHGGWLRNSSSFLVASVDLVILGDIHGETLLQVPFVPSLGVSTLTLSPSSNEALVFRSDSTLLSIPLLLQKPVQHGAFKIDSNPRGFLQITNTSSSYSETLEVLVSNISGFSCGFGHLAIVAQRKLMIFGLEKLLTPSIVDFTGQSVDLICLSPQSVALYDSLKVQFSVFSLTGQRIAVFALSPRPRSSFLSQNLVSLSSESLFIAGKL